ncbi:hypothetical protein [Radiobacillus kanasensis]|nr:hypothetical protein [Radiobacillus kanasensis]
MPVFKNLFTTKDNSCCDIQFAEVKEDCCEEDAACCGGTTHCC